MTSRERVAAVLRHETPDRLPSGWGGCETAGLHVLAHHRLKHALGLPDIPTRADTFMFNAVASPEFLRAIGGDVLLVASPNMCRSPLYGDAGWKPHSLFGCDIQLTANFALESAGDGYTYLLSDGARIMRCPPGGMYFDSIGSGDMLEARPLPAPSELNYRRQTSDERLRELEETAKRLYEQTEFALCLGEATTDLQLMPGGMMGWYELMLTDPDGAGEYLERAVEGALSDIRAVHQAAGKYCLMMSIAHDLGDRRGVTIGPDMFRKIYAPHYRRLFEGWHRLTDMKVNLHSCGSVADIIEDFIDFGVDVLNPVQISCDGMAPESLVARFGGRIVFYGGAYDAVMTPPTASADEVYRSVCANISALAKRGGYIFAGVHNTPADTPLEHLLAILRAFNDTRQIHE